MKGSCLALFALLQMMIGPLPEEEKTLTSALCAGGEITIPLGNEDKESKRDCHQQACHAGNCRQKAKRAN